MLAYLKELGPELLKSLFEIDTIEVILDDDSTRVQRMGASGWLLLSVFPVSKVKKILKNAKLAKKTGKAGNVIQLTEKELAILKKAESAGDGFKVEKNVGKKASGAKVPKATDLKNSNTVQNHINDIVRKGTNKGQLSRPYIDTDGTTLLLDEIMNAASPVKDRVLSNGLRWDVEGVFRGSKGTWELVIDKSTNTIVHFNFVN